MGWMQVCLGKTVVRVGNSYKVEHSYDEKVHKNYTKTMSPYHTLNFFLYF